MVINNKLERDLWNYGGKPLKKNLSKNGHLPGRNFRNFLLEKQNIISCIYVNYFMSRMISLSDELLVKDGCILSCSAV